MQRHTRFQTERCIPIDKHPELILPRTSSSEAINNGTAVIAHRVPRRVIGIVKYDRPNITHGGQNRLNRRDGQGHYGCQHISDSPFYESSDFHIYLHLFCSLCCRNSIIFKVWQLRPHLQSVCDTPGPLPLCSVPVFQKSVPLSAPYPSSGLPGRNSTRPAH